MDQNDLTGSEIMIDQELRDLIEELRADIAGLKLDVTLLSHDITKIREQLDKKQQPQESIGIVPTLPPDFLPPELM